MDIMLASSFRFENKLPGSRGGGGRGVDDASFAKDDGFVWRQGRSEVTVTREGDQWRVLFSTVGRLFGPREVLYDVRHRDAKHAAWDVMARVIRASANEDEGIRVARSAARWMREKTPD